VVDDGDEPLPGVNVVVKGTNRGTVTDLDGKFQVNAKDGEVLVFSFVGMETKEYEVGDRSDAFIKMKMDLWDLMGSVTIDGVYHTKPNLWARIKAWF
ncbi:MAG: carboxypeptidase-like regulatory domain-containing protein, partial [Bacteroidota bacterium]